MEKQKVTEITIPVPWGIIAGKTWGDPLDTPVLCIHGVQDNCDSLSRLISLLPKPFYYVCIDLPGHGKSSHFGKGILLDTFIYVLSMKRVVDHFNWTKIHYLGHSLGGILGIFFACIFPEHIEKIVSIDVIYSMIVEPENLTQNLRRKFRMLVDTEKKLSKTDIPSYTMDEVIERMTKGRQTNVTPEDVLVFVKRSLIQTESKMYRFTTDQRLKIGVNSLLSSQHLEEVLKGIHCPVLYIEAKKRKQSLFDCSELFKAYLKKSKNVVTFIVEGDHDVHLTHPERLIPVIESFFLTHKSQL